MAEIDPNEFSGRQFCGNCGAAVIPGASACETCGSPVLPEENAQEFGGDYIPYCRSCGVRVAREAAFYCPECGVTPLCKEHFYPSTRTCALCPPIETGQAAGSLPNRPSGPWPQAAAAVPCLQCGARIRQGVQFCANCGAMQAGAADVAKYAGAFARFGAFIIDNLILLVAGTILFAFVEIPALGLLITLPYYVGFTYKLGQTPGKKLLGLQVVDAEGATPNLNRVVLREVIAKSVPSMLIIAGTFSIFFLVAGYITGTIVMLGYLWIIRDRRRRGLHDYIAGTFVVKKEQTGNSS